MGFRAIAVDGGTKNVWISEHILAQETQEERNARRLRERDRSIAPFEGKESPSAMLACCDAMIRQLDREIAEDEYLAEIGQPVL